MYGRNVVRFQKVILVFSVGVVLIAAVGILFIEVEVDFTKFYKPGSEIRDSVDFMNQEMTGVMDIDIRVEGNLKSPESLNQMQVIQEFVDSHPHVCSTLSIVDIIKQMHRTIMDDDPKFEIIPESKEKVSNLFTLYSMSGTLDDFSSLIDYEYQTGLITALMGHITTTVIIEFVRDTEEMIQSITNDDIQTNITGILVIMRELVYSVIRSAFTSIAVSISMIFLISWVFFKKILWALLSVTPLVSAAVSYTHLTLPTSDLV